MGEGGQGDEVPAVLPSRPMPIFRRIFPALILCLTACSPGRQAPRETLHDLAALFPIAEVRREIGSLDFGSAEGRSHLTSGWYRNERSRDGGSFVWSKGEASEVEIFLATPRDLRLALRCAPFAVPQSMRVEVNDQALGPAGTIELSPGMHDYTVAVPAALLMAGTNRLTFRYRAVSAPTVDNGRRQLAVQWDALRFRPARQAVPEPTRSEKGALHLPFGTEVAYFVEVPAAGELALRRVVDEGAAGGRLVVTLQEESGVAEVREPALGSSARLELPGSETRLLRIAFRAVGPTPEAAGGLLVAAPVVRGARPERPARETRRRPWSGKPNIILYLVDTLRADRLGCYGSAKPLTPSVDAFARGATLFEDTVAQASWTRPSVTSILTGFDPLFHGVKTAADRLADEAWTLPEFLKAAGYRTAAFSTNPHISAETGLAQGFDDFQIFSEGPRSEIVNRHVVRWLDDHQAEQGKSPFFLYIHTLDPHAPYAPPFEMLQRFAPGVAPLAGTLEEVRRVYGERGEMRARSIAQLSALYDAEVAANDRSFGELLAALRARKLEDSALVIFVADHGEEFDEHGELGHGNNLYNESLHVPLIIKWPGQSRGERVKSLAQHLDLLPTLLRAAGLQPLDVLPGDDLFALAGEPFRNRRAFSHLSYEGRDGVSLVHGDWKLILPLSFKLGRGPELYRRDTDPAERDNLAQREEIRAGWLLAQIRLELLRTRGGLQAKPVAMDAEKKKALQALGYL
jgi:choline-sulfatase